MDPIKQLITEHEFILRILNVLTKINDKLSNNEKVSFEVIENTIEFLKFYADKLHHGKEEEILFLELTQENFHINQDLLREIEREHIQGRKLINNMSSELRAVKNRKTNNFENFVSFAWDYYDLLSQHIEKENKILFPEIDNALSADIRKKIANSFENVEKNKIGIDKITAQINTLKILENQFND